jgi:hypothetical protein
MRSRTAIYPRDAQSVMVPQPAAAVMTRYSAAARGASKMMDMIRSCLAEACCVVTDRLAVIAQIQHDIVLQLSGSRSRQGPQLDVKAVGSLIVRELDRHDA